LVCLCKTCHRKEDSKLQNKSIRQLDLGIKVRVKND
jgi:hypothetical protein